MAPRKPSGEHSVENQSVEDNKPRIDPKSRTLKIETGNDLYEIEKPRGKLGALHFRLLTKAMPKSTIEENGEQVVSPADQERMQEVFDQWLEEVLPNILISHKIDDLPGEDQWVIFLASFNTMNVRQDLFRLVA
ncbi:MAG: hypothetical protein WC877_00220 [Dehalococcoidales bacterium]|jgi:hypothetical protein